MEKRIIKRVSLWVSVVCSGRSRYGVISARNKQVRDGRFCSLTVHYLEQSREDEVFDKRKGKVKNNNTEGAKVFKGEKWKVYKCVGCWLLV